MRFSVFESQNYKTNPIRKSAPMTTFRQIEANRRNALKSTGPKSEGGKEQSRCNALRHGLTSETVIGLLEDHEDYRQFEAAVIADYDAQSAVERELVLRLASILWRLRRVTSMETGLFELQAEHLRESRHERQSLSNSQDATAFQDVMARCEGGLKPNNPISDFAQCFLRLANLPNFALDRLSRYEVALWRQASRILYALEILDRRKPQERKARFWFAREQS